MRSAPAILARGPWAPDQVQARWSEEHYAPPPERAAAADAAIAGLRDRGSPSHDGLAARLVRLEETDGGLVLDLQPVRWALRLVEGDASCSVASMCLTRDSEGRWLAGRRAPWLASWAGRWALGAGGAVDVGENPVATLTRELREEWSVEPERLSVDALVRLPHDLVMFVGTAWLPPGAVVRPDHEHDAYAWWPADVADWPEEAHDDLREIPRMLAESEARRP
jgi:ADP-ribose pyrophosphatase YjhB (NUDIX family)